MIRARGPISLLLGAILSVSPARAHEGHNEVPAPTDATPSRHVITAVSDRYELVVKNDPLSPRAKTTLELYLSDFATNGPVGKATLSLSLRAGGRELWKGTAESTDRPGVYAVPFVTPADTGSFNLLVTVQANGNEDRFALAGLDVRPVGHGSPRSPQAAPWRWLVGVASLIAVVGIIAWAVRRRRVAVPVAVLLMGLFAAASAFAHEGHDKPPAVSGAPVTPGAQVYMAKESQLLLGVKTEPARRALVRNRLTVFGRVAPRGGSEVAILAPQSGRVYFPESRVPVIGQSARKGQTVARLQVVDDLSLRAPLSGVITGVFVVSGQLVEAGQKIMTVLDPSVVWVHADVYESDLASVQRSTRAMITSSAIPDLLLTGRRVALGVTQGEVAGAVEAWFEVLNPGGRLKVGFLVEVGIELGDTDSALVVPRSAVFEKDGRKLLFVHTAPEQFAAREVTPTVNLGGRVAIEGDLKPGERVVVSGGYQLLSSPVISLGP